MKKKYYYILMFFSAAFLFIGLFFFSKGNDKSIVFTDKYVASYIDELNESIFKGLSKKALFDKYGIKDLDEVFILTGPDMYLKKYDSDLIKKYNLDSYLSWQMKYADRVENLIKKGFEVNYDGITIDNDNNFYSVDISYKVYNYTAYLNDLDELTYKIILTKYPNDTGDIKAHEDFYYKAKVKAMSIMDKNIDYYMDSEVRKTVFSSFENNSDYINSYIINLNGITSSFFNEKSDYSINQDSRINEYLNKIDKKNPIKL